MFKCEEYQRLDELIQAQLLWKDGVYLMRRSTERLHVYLYSLYNFYVEVFFDKAIIEPLYFKALDDCNSLDPYLEAISIKDAFEYCK